MRAMEDRLVGEGGIVLVYAMLHDLSECTIQYHTFTNKGRRRDGNQDRTKQLDDNNLEQIPVLKHRCSLSACDVSLPSRQSDVIHE